jgi:hypothetical protein
MGIWLTLAFDVPTAVAVVLLLNHYRSRGTLGVLVPMHEIKKGDRYVKLG